MSVCCRSQLGSLFVLTLSSSELKPPDAATYKDKSVLVSYALAVGKTNQFIYSCFIYFIYQFIYSVYIPVYMQHCIVWWTTSSYGSSKFWSLHNYHSEFLLQLFPFTKILKGWSMWLRCLHFHLNTLIIQLWSEYYTYLNEIMVYSG